MKDVLSKAYKRSFYGGRTIFSRIADTATFCLLLFAAFYIAALSAIRNAAAAVILSIILSAIGLVVSDAVIKARLEKHILRLREQLRHEVEQRKLLLLDLKSLRPQLEAAVGCPVWIDQSSSSISPDVIYSAARYMKRHGITRCVIIGISTLSEEAEKCIKSIEGITIEHRQAADISELSALVGVSEDEIDSVVLQKFGKREKRHPDPRLAIAPDRIKKYFVMGLLLYLLSFVMTYGIYMRIVASLAFSAAGALFVREEIKLQREKRRT